ncbi:MAG TPA: hypothetical protein PK447_06720 [Ignavibacteria bacterium]|nr:hypothetical protein [Ignavibacteria bacterium]
MAKKIKKKFETEITLLDRVQRELFDAIASKPDGSDYEAVRLYIDNLFITLNRSVTMVMDVKSILEKKENQEDDTETYNSPA